MAEERGKEWRLTSRPDSKKIAKKVRKESGYNIKVGPNRTTTGYTGENMP